MSRRMLDSGKAVCRARLAAREPEKLAGQRVLAFAGIAYPGKFYATLAEIGADVVTRRDFPDHHRFSSVELSGLTETASRGGLLLATTRKDAVRLDDGTAAARAFLASVKVLDVDLVFDRPSAAEGFVSGTLAARRGGRGA